MSISSEITRISNAKTAIAQSIANKGVTVPSGTKIDGMAALIDSIQTGGGGAVQPSKSLTVTSNGTTTITPDAPYDAIKQVDLTVNVSGSELATVTISVGTEISITYYDAIEKRPIAAYLQVGHDTIETLKNSVVGVYITSSGYAGITDAVGCFPVPYLSGAAILITDSTASFRVIDDT